MTRFGWVITTYLAALTADATALFQPAPKLLWNASASVPIGLYTVHRAGALHLGESVVVTPPEPLASFLDQRRYLPKGVPLLKRVVAPFLVRPSAVRIERSWSMVSRFATRLTAIISGVRCPSGRAAGSLLLDESS